MLKTSPSLKKKKIAVDQEEKPPRRAGKRNRSAERPKGKGEVGGGGRGENFLVRPTAPEGEP